jgi:hypothetical protein
MHPQVIRDAPGNCPIRGMALETVTQRVAAQRLLRESTWSPEPDPLANGSVRYRTDSTPSSRSLVDVGHAGSFREFAA